MDDLIDDFDAEGAVNAYRRVIAKLEAQTDGPDKAKYENMAKKMRTAWKGWQGEDSLHEMAFGEPEEFSRQP